MFRGKEGTIELSFKQINGQLQKPILTSSTGEKIIIPLLLDTYQIEKVHGMLSRLKRDTEHSLESLRNIVTGACSISMRAGY